MTLGCPKNRVDTEWVAADLEAKGLVQVGEPEEADLLVVNTCAFLQEAVEESVETILDAARWKAERPGARLVVLGCLPQRYGRDLADSLPEVDVFVGCGRLGQAAELILEGRRTEGIDMRRPSYLPDGVVRRQSSLGAHVAYLKVAEGCSRRCSFCVVPRIRGPQRSRPLQDVIAEARQLAAAGVREVILVAQDLVSYGRDLGLRDGLVRLLGALGEVGLPWIRLMYLHPRGLTDEVLELARQVCVPYLDVPIQHVADPVLRAMRRPYRERDVRRLLDRVRRIWPEAWLRTTLLVGHPGEGRQEYILLKKFVQDARFDHLGVFSFSPEEGTASAAMRPRPARRTAERRRGELMALQKEISRARLERLVGRELTVLVDGPGPEHLWEARHEGQAPEVDGLVYVTGDERQADGAARLRPGDFVLVRVERSGDYDLAGPVVGGVR